MDKPHKHQPAQNEAFDYVEGREQETRASDDELTPSPQAGTLGVSDALDLKSDKLYLNAINELRIIKSKLSLSSQEREKSLRVFLAHAYALSMEGKRNSARHAALLVQTRIKVREDTPYHKQTIRALQAKLGERLPKGSEHEWAQVLWGLEEAGVGESENAVGTFLTEPGDVGGKLVRGFERAHAVLRNSKKINGERDHRRAKLDAEREGTFSNIIAASRKQPVGTISAAEDIEFDAGLWLCVNEGENALLKLQIPAKDMPALVLRFRPQS